MTTTLRTRTPALPPSQPIRLRVLDAILRAAADGLPIPDVDFHDHTSGGVSVDLRLMAGDRVGVNAWAARIGLPAGAATLDGTTYHTQLHGRPSDNVWLGASWVKVWCSMPGGDR